MGNNKITEHRAIFQRERQNSSINKQTKSVNYRKTGKKHNQSPGPGCLSYVVGLPSNSYKPITNTAWVSVRLWKLQKWCIRLAAASEKAYRLLAHGRWFSPGTSTTKTDRHDITEILLKVALSTINQIKLNNLCSRRFSYCWGKKIGRKIFLLLGKNGRNLKPKKFVIYVPLRRNTTAEMARYSR
jgi:hypothetical protein